MRNRQPFLCSVLFPVVHVTRCIHVTWHVALHLLKCLLFVLKKVELDATVVAQWKSEEDGHIV